ncbi:hypothetical protein ACHAXS_013397 [Conticribra weissflogii]
MTVKLKLKVPRLLHNEGPFGDSDGDYIHQDRPKTRDALSLIEENHPSIHNRQVCIFSGNKRDDNALTMQLEYEQVRRTIKNYRNMSTCKYVLGGLDGCEKSMSWDHSSGQAMHRTFHYL